MNDTAKQQDQIDSLAADWVVKLGGGPLSSAERAELERWLDQNIEHRLAFDEAQLAWAKMGALRTAPGALANDINPDRFVALEPTTLAKALSSSLWHRVPAMAACLTLVVIGLGTWFADPLLMLSTDHRTAPGERRTLTLEDGSRIELGPHSAITIDYDAQTRRVKLLSGVGYFMPRRLDADETRPFVVDAVDVSAQALGTEFTVETLDDGAQVIVTEHQVRVFLRDNQSVSTLLAPGQAVRSAKQHLGTIHNVNLDRSTGWRRDRLTFDNVSLAEVIATLNRYRAGRIIITDAAMGTRKVSGVFQMGTPEQALATISSSLELDTVSITPLVTLLY
ncbi:MAG: FecR domain-containing protein [Pseudomonadota bacterium]